MGKLTHLTVPRGACALLALKVTMFAFDGVVRTPAPLAWKTAEARVL